MNRINFRYRLNGVNYAFSVNAPYTAGHLLTAEEAEAMNVLRSENIRDGARAAFNEISKALAKDQILSEAQLTDLQAQIDEVDLTYQMGRNSSARDKLGAIEKEARLLALARAPEEATDEEIELLAQSVDLVAEARERIEVRTKIMAAELESLK